MITLTDLGIKPREWFGIPKFGTTACIGSDTRITLTTVAKVVV